MNFAPWNPPKCPRPVMLQLQHQSPLLSLFNSQTHTHTACACVCCCVSFCATLSSLLSQRASSSGVSQAFLIHFWDLRPILSSSQHHFNPSIIPLFILQQFEANSSSFHRKIQMKLSHSSNFTFFSPAIVHRLLPFSSFMQQFRWFFFSCCLLPYPSLSSSCSPNRPCRQMRLLQAGSRGLPVPVQADYKSPLCS